MRFPVECYLGKDPSIYARRVLQECGLRDPPICERTVTNYLGLELKEFSVDGFPRNEGLREAVSNAPAWLRRKPDGKSCIWVRNDICIGRKRNSIFHECGHAILPWHQELNYLCDERDIHPTVQKHAEREAFQCGNELLMPREPFVEDLLGLETSVFSIEQLSRRYLASMEAAAIRYASLHPGICGMVMVESNDSQASKETTQPHHAAAHPTLLACTPCEETRGHNKQEYPLRIKYFIGSHSFREQTGKYIRAGTQIGQDSLVFAAWFSGERKTGKIPACALGSSSKWAYNADCLPYGKQGTVLVLLWLPDRQCRLSLDLDPGA